VAPFGSTTLTFNRCNMTDYSTSRFHAITRGPSSTSASIGDFDANGEGKFSSSSPRTLQFVYYDQRSGVDNPRWRDIIRNRGDATTGFSGGANSDPFDDWVSSTLDITDQRKADKHIRHRSFLFDGRFWVNPPPGVVVVTDSVKADVRNRCIRRFLDAVDSAQSSFEAGQDLGEYRETIQSIQKPLHPLRTKILSYLDSLKKAKHRYRGSIPSLKKVLADTYLEFHFGWQPLVADVAKGIADCGRFRFPVIPVRASAKSRWKVTGATEHASYDFWPVGVSRWYRDTSTYSLRYKGAVRVKGLMPSGQLSWAQSLQLTPDKWLPTAWDLLPYSWMADYFINIGEIIRGFSSLGTDLAWGAVTERTLTERQFSDVEIDEVSYDPNGPIAKVSVSKSSFGGAGVLNSHLINRSRLDSLSLIPSLQFSVPTGKYAFANMGSVLLQRAEKLIPFF